MKPTLYMMRGGDRAERTRQARDICKRVGAVRISREDLRDMLWGGGPAMSMEYIVKYAANIMSQELLHKGTSVVIDDANDDRRNEVIWHALASLEGAAFEVVEVGDE